MKNLMFKVFYGLIGIGKSDGSFKGMLKEIKRDKHQWKFEPSHLLQFLISLIETLTKSLMAADYVVEVGCFAGAATFTVKIN